MLLQTRSSRASRTAALAAVAGLLATMLTACSGTTDTSALDPVAQSSSEAFADAPDDALPVVRGKFGARPDVVIPDREPPTRSAMRVLQRGTGDEVLADDLVVTQFLAQTWAGSRLFDESWDDGLPVASSLAEGASIPAWSAAFVGLPVGSRVLLVVAPELGYGAEGLPESGISGTDTLVYVVDLLGRHGPQDSAAGPAEEPPADLPAVGDGEDGIPLIVTDVKQPPAVLTKAVVLTGAGVPIRNGDLVVTQILARTWRSEAPVTNTWTAHAPETVRIGEESLLPPGAEKSLIGVPVGSRLLVSVPPADGFNGGLPAADVQADDTLIYLIDVLGAYAPARGTGTVTAEPDED